MDACAREQLSCHAVESLILVTNLSKDLRMAQTALPISVPAPPSPLESSWHHAVRTNQVALNPGMSTNAFVAKTRKQFVTLGKRGIRIADF